MNDTTLVLCPDKTGATRAAWLQVDAPAELHDELVSLATFCLRRTLVALPASRAVPHWSIKVEAAPASGYVSYITATSPVLRAQSRDPDPDAFLAVWNGFVVVEQLLLNRRVMAHMPPARDVRPVVGGYPVS